MGGLHHVGFAVVPALLPSCPVSDTSYVQKARMLNFRIYASHGMLVFCPILQEKVGVVGI
jgi:hypothetical protein